MKFFSSKPKAYHGRLAFDSVSGFHVDPKGKKVISLDGGQTWQYATSSDVSHVSHVERYHKNTVGIDTTANELIGLIAEYGSDKAEQMMHDKEPHHFSVTLNDPHHHSKGGVVQHPDAISDKTTSHTDAPHGSEVMPV